MYSRFTIFLVLACGCGSGGGSGTDAGPADAGEPPMASEDWNRDILVTDIALDVGVGTATAKITLAGSTSTGASFEVGDLMIDRVRTSDGLDLHTTHSGAQLDVGVFAGDDPVEIVVDYRFRNHSNFDGWMSSAGVTLLWPYFCGNLFPCKSDPSDGISFELTIAGTSSLLDVIVPPRVEAQAPSYMPAVAVGDYTEVVLGETAAGTEVVAWHLPGQQQATADGTANLLAVFEFLETTYGPYSFGDRVGSVAANWGGGSLGGMEHHPYWHVASGAMSSEEVHAHEAAHGWYGNGVRIQCWEDFVLSEGTVTYMAARSLSSEDVDLWPEYGCEMASYCDDEETNTVALLETCNEIDIFNHPLWSGVPYMKGAFFMRQVAELIGAESLDEVLGDFYQDKVGSAARMNELIAAIKSAHPSDAEAVEQLAEQWLRQLACPIASDVLCPD